MTTPTIPALPSFADRAAQQPAAPQLPNTPNAPSGGANSPPAPAPQQAVPGGPGFQQPPAAPAAPAQPPAAGSLVQRYEQAGRIPAGRFRTDEELVEALYGVAETTANELEQLRQTPQARPATPQPEPPQAPEVPADELTRMATTFQQNGWLSLQNGQWVAANPLASQLAGQLNQRIVEAQARQAELADPVSFFRKYGKQALQEDLTPLQQELNALKEQYQHLQRQVLEAAPKPWDGFMKEYETQLWTTENGARVPSPAGKVYHDAFEMARQYGMSPADIHKFAETATRPYLQQPQAAPPQQTSWMQGVMTNPGQTDPGFNRPGTVLNNSVPPGSAAVPRTNDGFTSFDLLAQMPR